MADKFLALDEAGKADFIQRSINSPALEPFRQYMSEGMLEDFFYQGYVKDNSLVEYWVQDIQFVADSLGDLQTPIARFPEMLDLGRMGVIGMSFGGAAAGEFCKIDSRCKAAANLDGTQFGRHWDRKVPDCVQLEFFNHYLKGKPRHEGMIAGIPEIVVRQVPMDQL